MYSIYARYLYNLLIVSPIIEIPHPAVLRTWYRKRTRHEDRVKEGRESKPPPMPPQEDVFSRSVKR